VAAERPAGVLLEGKYRLLDEVGRGGMGAVFRARDESLDRVVAVKFLLPELEADPALLERFRREAKAMASVRHGNVLQIFAFGRQGPTAFFVMEYIDGRSVDDLLDQARDNSEFLPLGQALRLLAQAADGLEAVHRAGVVHRDVKPANIMVEAGTDRAVIMDFGIGKRYGADDGKRTFTTSGTPAYMAPEIVSGLAIAAEDDFRSDIYAFGVTAFEVLTSSLPFDAETWVDLCVKHVTQEPPAPSARRSNIPPEVDAIVLRCLAKEPRERFAGCAQLRDALRAQLRELPSRRPTPLPPRVAERSRLRRNVVSGVVRTARVIAADPDASFRYAVYQAAHDVFPECRFLAAKTNAKALELAGEMPPSLLFAPLEDAGLNGLELVASLAAQHDLRRLKVVLTAERVTADERRMLQGLGAHDVLLKPVGEEALREVMEQMARSEEPCVGNGGPGHAR
jgi:serine/threonine-protein kinase